MKHRLNGWKTILLVFFMAAVFAWAGYTGYWLYHAYRMVSAVEDKALQAELSLWQVRSDLQAINSKSGAIATNLEIAGINEDGHYVYQDYMENIDVTDYIDTWKEGTSTFIRIREGELENILEFKWNGDLILDGNEVGFD